MDVRGDPILEHGTFRRQKMRDLIEARCAVNGTLNLTRACRYRHCEPDPSASSPCPARENNVVRYFPLCPSLCWVAP